MHSAIANVNDLPLTQDIDTQIADNISHNLLIPHKSTHDISDIMANNSNNNNNNAQDSHYWINTDEERFFDEYMSKEQLTAAYWDI